MRLCAMCVRYAELLTAPVLIARIICAGNCKCAERFATDIAHSLFCDIRSLPMNIETILRFLLYHFYSLEVTY